MLDDKLLVSQLYHPYEFCHDYIFASVQITDLLLLGIVLLNFITLYNRLINLDRHFS